MAVDKTILTLEESGIESIQADFIPQEFRVLIENQGYDCIYERAIMCPCLAEDSNEHRMTCQNCGGSGWLFVNPTQMRFVLTSIKLDETFGPEGKLDTGMMYATSTSLVKLSKMDRITVLDGETAHSEVLHMKKDVDDTGLFFALTNYYIDTVGS